MTALRNVPSEKWPIPHISMCLLVPSPVVGEGWCVGRHTRPEQPQPEAKPRHRFVVAFSTIFLLAFASMAVVAAIFPEQGPQAKASGDPTGVGTPFPPIPAGQPADTSLGSTTVIATSGTGQVSGTFAVSQDWNEGFIGNVALSNTSASPQAWQVQLVFPDIVGQLQSRWISDGPGDSTVARSGQTVTFTGQQPLAAGAHIGVFFQFAKGPGDPSPRNCLVNGSPCAR